MLKQLIKFLKIISGDVSPSQIAAGLSFGLFFALTPLFSLHNLVVLLVICLFRVNLTAVLVSLVVFSPVAYLMDPFFTGLGEKVLTSPQLAGLWTVMYQQEIWRLAHFNNTLTMGSFLVSAALLIPCFFVFRWLVVRYRSRFMQYINRLHVVQWLKASKAFRLMLTVSNTMEGKG